MTSYLQRDPHTFECPEGYGRACRNPLCRIMYVRQARLLAEREKPLSRERDA